MQRERRLSRLASYGLGLVFVVLTGLVLWGTTATQAAAERTREAVTLSESYDEAARIVASETLLEREYRLKPSPASIGHQRAVAATLVAALRRVSDRGNDDDRRIVSRALAAQSTYVDSTAVMFAAVDAGDSSFVRMIDERSVEPPLIEIASIVNDRRIELHRRAIVSLANLVSTQETVRHTTLTMLTLGIVLLAAFVAILGTYRRRLDETTERELTRLAHEAMTDNLTELGNHRAFHEAFARATEAARAHDTELVLAIVDLDEFKLVNDAGGHSLGDRVLSLVGTLLGALRSADGCLPFRIGGDEFALLLPDMSLGTAVAIMRRFQERCALEHCGVTISIGLAALDRHAGDTELLQERADAALYEAKRRGRDTLVTFDEIAGRAAEPSLTKRAALRRLIEDGNVRVVFQPIWDLDRLEILGFEALTRFSSTYGFSGPQEAFDLAERTGHAHHLDAVCRMAILARANELPTDALLFINVSPQTLEFQVLAGNALVDAAERAGMQPERIVLEITERSLARPSAVVREAIRLRALGFRLALDDVGAGNNGLEMLGRLPVDYLKIDGAIVDKAVDDRPSQSVIAGILAIARANGSYVIAEGIEDEATLAFLRGYGAFDSERSAISGAQGYALGRPSENVADFASRPDVLQPT